MEKELGKEIAAGEKRQAYLKDNADGMESKQYMQRYTPEEITSLKSELSELDIKIGDIGDEKAQAKAEFKARIDPLAQRRGVVIQDIKQKAHSVTEDCYKFVDCENREVGFYNADGDLIEARPAMADELQGNIFRPEFGQKNGTTNK